MIGQERAKRALVGGGLQPLQAHQPPGPADDEVEIEKSNILLLGPTGRGQDAAGPDPGPDPQRALHHRRRHDPHRGGLRRRGRGEHPGAAAAGGGLQHRRVRARHRLHRRDRQDRAQVARTRPSPATCRARGSSRPCSRSSKGTVAQRAAAGRAEAPAAGVHPDQHQGHPVHLRRGVRRAREDHRGADRPAPDRASPESRSRRPHETATNPFPDVEPEDLLRYGLIPELVGRLPVIVRAGGAGRGCARARSCVEPKNALTKQYKKLFELENVGLTFDPEALRAVAGGPSRGAAAPAACGRSSRT